MSFDISRRALLAGFFATAVTNAEAFDFGAPLSKEQSNFFGGDQVTPRQRQAAEPSYNRIPVNIADYNGNAAVGSILVSIANAKLYHVSQPGQVVVYPIAAGPDSKSIAGQSLMVNHQTDWPDWRPTENIRRKAEARGEFLPAVVSGGENNPLGARALYLYSGGADTIYRIHGTNQPWTIGDNSASSGCIRMYNDHVVELGNQISDGTQVSVYNGSVPGVGRKLRRLEM